MQIQESKPFYHFYFVKPTVVVRGVLWLQYTVLYTDYGQIMFSGIVLQCPRLSQNCVVRVKGNESWGVEYAKYCILNVFSLKSVCIVLGAISPPNWTFKKKKFQPR